MATITRKQWRIARTDSGTPPVVYELPEAASQTFKANDLVTLDASGRVTGVTGDDDTVFWGVAEEDAHNDSVAGHSYARVFRLTTDLTFIANMVDAALAAHVALVTDRGPMGIVYDETNKKFFLDASEQGGADDRVQVIDLAPGSALGDTDAEWYCKFLSTAIQAG